jgi:hypothetical protein
MEPLTDHIPEPRFVYDLAKDLRWVWAVESQVDRFTAVYDRDSVGSRPSLLACMRDLGEGFWEAHFLLLAAAHAGSRLATLSRDTGNRDLTLPDDLLEDIKMWRDSWEHWDEQAPTFRDPTLPRHRAGAKMERKYGTETHPGAIHRDENGLWLGKIELYGLRGELQKRELLLKTPPA